MIMGTVDIRPSDAADLEWAAVLMAVSEPWATLGRDYDACLRACTRDGDQMLVARVEGARAGMVIVRPGGVAGAPYIPSIVVGPEFRSQRVGAALIAHVEAMFRGRARYLFLCVSSFNHRARAFYLREGFAAMGEFPDFIVDGASEVLMGKRL
jgi:ribosomal-protein-alanine N-acetyltransferase